MATGLTVWSTTASSNATADSAVNMAEGMAPGAVNDSVRALMASAAKWRDDNNGTIATGGSSTAYTVTTGQTLASLTAGYTVAFAVHTASGATVTLNVDSLGAKPLRSSPGVELKAGRLASGAIGHATYASSNGGEWLLHGKDSEFVSGTVMLFVQTSAPTGWTKGSTHNDKALRVVTGSVSTGGSTAFSSIFTNLATNSYTLQTADIPAHTHTGTTAESGADHTHGGTTGNASADHTHSGTTGGQSNTHTHGYNDVGTGSGYTFGADSGTFPNDNARTTGNASADHSHSFTTGGQSATHTHTFTSGTGSIHHTHTFTSAATGGGGGHSHVMPLTLQYVDVIIATKD